MTDGARQRSSTAGSSKDAAEGKQSGGAVALKKEIGLVSACGIIVGECAKAGFIRTAERRGGDQIPPGLRVTSQIRWMFPEEIEMDGEIIKLPRAARFNQ